MDNTYNQIKGYAQQGASIGAIPGTGTKREDDFKRLEALRMAVEHMPSGKIVDTAICAEVFLEFLNGKSRRISEEPRG
jgi:hypothetical protein